MTDDKTVLIAALKEIATEPKGAYSRDRATYLDNVIEWMQTRAKDALEEIGKPVK